MTHVRIVLLSNDENGFGFGGSTGAEGRQTVRCARQVTDVHQLQKKKSVLECSCVLCVRGHTRRFFCVVSVYSCA